MIKHSIYRTILYLFVMVQVFSCKGQTSHTTNPAATQLQQKLNDWMRPYRQEQSAKFDHWLSLLKNYPDSLLHDPVYNHIDSFYNRYQAQLLQLRKVDLARYTPLPKNLPGYEPAKDFYASFNDDYSSILHFIELTSRVGKSSTFTVADARAISSGMDGFVLQYLNRERGMKEHELSFRYLFGEWMFADSVAENQWRITVVNRIYALQYQWDIKNNTFSAPLLWVFTGKQQSKDWLINEIPKANTPAQTLRNRLNAFRWALYDEPAFKEDKESPAIVLDSCLQKFYAAHRAEYTTLRSTELATYPQANDTYWKRFTQDTPGLKSALLATLKRKGNQYLLPAFLATYETDSRQSYDEFFYRILSHDEYNNYHISSWIAGQDIYTKEIGKNIWEMQFFYRQYAIRYRWNIATDELSDVEVKLKNEN